MTGVEQGCMGHFCWHAMMKIVRSFRASAKLVEHTESKTGNFMPSVLLLCDKFAEQKSLHCHFDFEMSLSDRSAYARCFCYNFLHKSSEIPDIIATN